MAGHVHQICTKWPCHKNKLFSQSVDFSLTDIFCVDNKNNSYNSSYKSIMMMINGSNDDDGDSG